MSSHLCTYPTGLELEQKKRNNRYKDRKSCWNRYKTIIFSGNFFNKFIFSNKKIIIINI